MRFLATKHLGLAVALMVPLASLGMTSSAMAKEPTGDFAIFKQCPRFTGGVNHCLYSTIKSGEVTIGKTSVPITNPITLQGGYDRTEGPITYTFVGAINGETLSKSPQKVPGGLLDLVKCNEISNFLEKIACELVFENGTDGCQCHRPNSRSRPAKSGSTPTTSLNEEGVALSLPVKVHLENPFLGSECYVGSSSSPVTLNLTTGTTSPPQPNKPISGKLGELRIQRRMRIHRKLPKASLVDNSFSVPAANGCGGIFSFLIDPIVDCETGTSVGRRKQHGDPERQHVLGDCRKSHRKRNIGAERLTVLSLVIHLMGARRLA